MNNVVTSRILDGFSRIATNCLNRGPLSTDAMNTPFDLMNGEYTALLNEIYSQRH